MQAVESFEAKRLRASGGGQTCCKSSNILLVVLVGFILIYVVVAVHVYVGSSTPTVPEATNSNQIIVAYSSPELLSPMQAAGLRGSAEPLNDKSVMSPVSSYIDTMAADGIDDGVTAVVRCSTSQGNLTVDVRRNWAPIGSERFLDLVENGFFTDLPFFRVCPRYITQFGPKFGGGNYHLKRIEDDKSLWGIRDMNFGYVFFAGSGKNSRGSQMVVALCETKGCVQTTLGRATWEVPVGTIRKEGFAALRAIARSGKPYPKLEMPSQAAGAGGPDQSRIVADRNYLKEHYPFMEYWYSCRVEQRSIHVSRPLSVDFSEKFDII